MGSTARHTREAGQRTGFPVCLAIIDQSPDYELDDVLIVEDPKQLRALADDFRVHGFRASVDEREETLGRRIRDAELQKSFDPERSHFFQDAGFGNFAEAYREGFMEGYNAGFDS